MVKNDYKGWWSKNQNQAVTVDHDYGILYMIRLIMAEREQGISIST